jgi:hypothetical protein
MKTTNQNSTSGFTVAIGNAMIIDAILAAFGTRGRNLGKSKLRSQDMQFTLVAMPSRIICLPEKIISLAEWVMGTIHTTFPSRMNDLTISFSLPEIFRESSVS